MRLSLKVKMVLIFSVVTVVIWIATVGYTFPTVAVLLQEAARHGNADQAFRIFQRNILVAGTGGTLFSIFVGYIMSVVILGPVGQVVKAMKRAEKGDLTVQTACKSNDELLDLARGFNLMVENFRTFVLKIREVAAEVAEMAGNLQADVEQSSQSTEQIAQTIQQVALGMENQTGSIEDISATISRMSEDIQQIAANARAVSDLSRETAEIASQGGVTISKSIEQMKVISKAVHSSSQTVGLLGERSIEIGQIVETITSIAEQTNLLALNAAIEAARAGEQGRGFAVVAEEVRKLAEQAGAAAGQIAEMIQQIQQDTKKAVESMEQGTQEAAGGIQVVTEAGRAFETIIKSVEDVAGKFNKSLMLPSKWRPAAPGGSAYGADRKHCRPNRRKHPGAGSFRGGNSRQLSGAPEYVNRLSNLSKDLMDMVKHMQTEN
ncbi:MAG: methyl-accepting chemotaxis protein [Bacillota bacterium]